MRRSRSLAVFVSLLAALLLAPVPGVASVDLENAMRQMIRSSNLGQTEVSVFAMDVGTGDVIAAIEADRPMTPASNMKLVTTAAALDVLGPEFVFRTELLLSTPASPAPAAANLPDLVVKGDGDPAFGDPILLGQHDVKVDQILDGWTQAVVATGQKHFSRLVVDDRVFDFDFAHDDWSNSDLVKAYGAQVAGVNFYNNVVDVLPVPTREGQAPSVSLFPVTSAFFETTNRAKTGKTDYFILDRKLETNQLIFAGTIRNRRSAPFQISVHDPAMYFGQVLATRLAKEGIRIERLERPQPMEEFPDVRPLHVVQTTLPLVLARTNQDSQNMFAEALMKRMGRQLTGQPGSWENGAAAVRAALRERLGARSSAIIVADGSGMSRSNRVTARLLVELLRSLHGDADRGHIYLTSLSEAGETGTLQQRLDTLNGRVFGKSGYVNGVSSLSGYLVIPPPADRPGSEPRTIAFSLLFNGFKPPLSNSDIKRVQNGLVALIDKAYAPAKRKAEPANLGG